MKVVLVDSEPHFSVFSRGQQHYFFQRRVPGWIDLRVIQKRRIGEFQFLESALQIGFMRAQRTRGNQLRKDRTTISAQIIHYTQLRIVQGR